MINEPAEKRGGLPKGIRGVFLQKVKRTAAFRKKMTEGGRHMRQGRGRNVVRVRYRS